MQNFNYPISSSDEALLMETGLTEIMLDIDEDFVWDNEALHSAILETPVINLSNKILIEAIKKNASAIHIEPLEDSLRIRFRIDDVLHQPFEPLPKKIIPLIIARFKIIADLSIATRHYPQSGIIHKIYQGRKIDFLIDTLPTRYGEKIVLRIRRWERNIVDLNLDKLITDRQTLQLIKVMISHPFGLILVTGIGGSGMTTTLYSLLKEMNKPDINICATDEFLEYSVPGITQVQSNLHNKGIGFTPIIQGFMQQDPDVILVNETRCKETAKTVIEAAERCLALTGLHANDAPGAISRLDEMGIEPLMISHILIGVIAQRLLRRVCPNCAIPYTPTKEESAYFDISAPIQKITIYKANTRKERLAKKALGNLCPNCHGIGYKGFVGVYQVMPVTSKIKSLINEGVSTNILYQVAKTEGMKSFFDYSLDLVWQKHTTLEEVNRLIQNDNSWGSQLIRNPQKLLQDLERQVENITDQIKQVKQQIKKRVTEDYF